jgi:hypothetical protein
MPKVTELLREYRRALMVRAGKRATTAPTVRPSLRGKPQLPPMPEMRAHRPASDHPSEDVTFLTIPVAGFH